MVVHLKKTNKNNWVKFGNIKLPTPEVIKIDKWNGVVIFGECDYKNLNKWVGDIKTLRISLVAIDDILLKRSMLKRNFRQKNGKYDIYFIAAID